MIDAKDLRIGNWVNYNGLSYQIWDNITKHSVDLDSLIMDTNIKCVPCKKLKPILLTSSILSNCKKIEKIGGLFSLWNHSIYSLFPNKKNSYTLVYNCEEEMVNIDYLHELQNFYHAITKKELEYKP